MMVNLLAVGIASVAAMAVGALWFGPLLGRRWAALAGVDRSAATPGWVYALAMVATAVTAAVLAVAAAVVYDAVGGSFLGTALAVAGLGWLGFTASRSAVEFLFERRPASLFAVDAMHQLVVVAVMGLIIGAFGR